jgi:hypothetical protein
MRFFELNNNTAQTPQVDPSNLEGLLAQTKDNPKAFSIASQGIDALLDATNKMVSLVKASSISSVAAPVNKIPPINPLESTFSEAVDSIPTYQQRLKSIEENVKFLKTMTKANKKMLEVVGNLEKEMKELRKSIKDALKSAAETYKSLDPFITKMLAKTGSDNPGDIAKARELFVNDDIPILDAKRFLQVAQTGVIDMNKLILQSKGTIDQFVVKDPVVKRVYDKVVDDFINWIPGKTAGNIGPGELMFVMLGNPAGKEKKGDLRIGKEMFEVKAGNRTQTELKKGGLGVPKRTGAIFDTGISGKAVWPAISELLTAAGFENMTTDPVKKADGTVEQYSRYNLLNTNFENWNQEFTRLKMNIDSRADLLARIAKIIFPIKTFNFEGVKSRINQILSASKGNLVSAAVPPGESKQLENDIPLLRYFTELGLQTYRQEGKSKDNFLFLNKTTKEFRIYRGSELDAEISKPDSELKILSGLAFSLTDSQSKAVPRITLG